MPEVDVNRPLENPRLKELFARRRTAGSREEMARIMEELAEEIVMNGRFLSVVQFSREPEKREDGTAVFLEDTQMSVPMLSAGDGKHFYPAFIDWEELGRWRGLEDFSKGEPPQTLILGFDDYAAMVDRGDSDGVAINPFSDNLVLERETLARWRERKELRLAGHTERVVEKGTQVRLGEPAEYPHALVEAMAAYAKGERGIQRLWLRLMEQSGVFNWLVVVQFEGDKRRIFDGLGAAALPHLMGRYVDIVPASEAFGRDASKGVKPFYERRFRLFG